MRLDCALRGSPTFVRQQLTETVTTPEDLFDPDTEWRPDTNPPPIVAPGEQPF